MILRKERTKLETEREREREREESCQSVQSERGLSIFVGAGSEVKNT
jgi:hypothetical protein